VVSVNQPSKAFSAGQSYTLSFWAKSSAARPVQAVIQEQNSPYTVYTTQTANLTTAWARYTFAFTPSSSTATAMFNINLADATGSIWVDEVSLCRTGMVCSSTPLPPTPSPTIRKIFVPTVTVTVVE
jgi:hypothetical protein